MVVGVDHSAGAGVEMHLGKSVDVCGWTDVVHARCLHLCCIHLLRAWVYVWVDALTGSFGAGRCEVRETDNLKVERETDNRGSRGRLRYQQEDPKNFFSLFFLTIVRHRKPRNQHMAKGKTKTRKWCM